MREPVLKLIDLEKELNPETPLEKQLLAEPVFVRGLFWGVPRYGHPEGEIYKHIQEVQGNIERLDLPPALRLQLRLVALAHDTFKYLEHKESPRDWSRHHGVLARRFLEMRTDDQVVLSITELHDEAYYSWRAAHLYHRPLDGENRLRRLVDRIGEHLQLFYLFFKCDTLTGDKNPAPLKWFEKALPQLELIDLQ